MLQQLGYPLPLSLGLVVLGTILFWSRWRATGTAVIGTAVIGLYLLSTPAVASLLMTSLERGYPYAAPAAYPAADAIVVLGGGIIPAVVPERSANLLDAADRIRTGARLYHAGKAPLVITTGTRPFPNPGATAARAAADLLGEFGVPERAIVAPGTATSTRGDALAVRAAAERHDLDRVLLVTSAFHMPRALATFHAVGLDVRPVPTDHMGADFATSGAWAWLPDHTAFSRSNKAWHEYAGRAYYRLKGWI